MKTSCLLACLLALSACKKDEDATLAESAPSLPPSGSLSLDVSSFSDSGFQEPGGALTAAQSNYALGLVVVGLINTSVATVLTPPSRAIGAALTQTPTKNADATWTFAYTSSPFVVELTGKILSADSAQWTMVVDRSPADSNGCCSNYTWLEGTTQAAKSGSWTINDARTPTATSKLFAVDWEVSSDTDRQLTITAEQDLSADFKEGGTVSYILKDNQIKLTVIDDPVAQASVVVVWDVSTRSGSLKGKSGAKVCWDSDKNNVTCS